jgi:hypothetical protein
MIHVAHLLGENALIPEDFSSKRTGPYEQLGNLGRMRVTCPIEILHPTGLETPTDASWINEIRVEKTPFP